MERKVNRPHDDLEELREYGAAAFARLVLEESQLLILRNFINTQEENQQNDTTDKTRLENLSHLFFNVLLKFLNLQGDYVAQVDLIAFNVERSPTEPNIPEEHKLLVAAGMVTMWNLIREGIVVIRKFNPFFDLDLRGLIPTLPCDQITPDDSLRTNGFYN
jgi:hypothetical protein